MLPAKLATTYGKPGVRPDLLFDFGNDEGEEEGRLAGEARGRSAARPGKLPHKRQHERLNEIVAWSGKNDFHPVTMTYTFTMHDRLHVDLYHVQHLGLKDEPASFVDASDTAERERLRGRRYEPVQSLRSRALNRVMEITDQLYETAPEGVDGTEVAVFDREVRGSWSSTDLLFGSGTRFFLGVLSAPLSPEQASRPRRRRIRQQDRESDPIQVAVAGRLLVAVARDARTADPDWSEVAERIEGD